MKGRKTTLVVAISVGLLAGSTVGVAAQDEADLALATPIYYTWENGEWPASERVDGTFDEATGVLTGRSGGEIPITASDPRFDGTAWVTINGQVGIRPGTPERDDHGRRQRRGVPRRRVATGCHHKRE